MIRLKAMAHVRALTMAAMIKPNVDQPGQPSFSREATTMAATAKGRAKIVCENFTNSPHLRICENILANRAPPASEERVSAGRPNDRGPVRRRYPRPPRWWRDACRKEDSPV